MTENYDIIIVGSGFVGASLAIMLARQSLRIALIDSTPSEFLHKKNVNERSLVLSHTSKVILETIGIWEEFSDEVTPIEIIHISDRGHFGTTVITAQEEKIPALGYVLSAKKIDSILNKLLQQFSNIKIIQPAKFSSFIYDDKTACVELLCDSELVKIRGKLLVAADGQESSIRKYQHFTVETIDYQQTAVLCNIKLKKPHKQVAYERFTEQGPLAILPLDENQGAVVWTVDQQNAATILAMDNQQFLSLLQAQFGYRLGKFIDATKRVAVPLKLVVTKEQIAPGLVLVGNAVHTLHPVAGQGLNLALRDIAVLSEEILVAMKQHQSCGDLLTLQKYLNRRLPDQKKIISMTHSLVSIFSNSLFPVVFTRDMGLILIDRLPWLKKILTKRALGMSGKVPRLACGLQLD